MDDKSDKKFSKSRCNKNLSDYDSDSDCKKLSWKDFLQKWKDDDEWFKEFEEKHTDFSKCTKSMTHETDPFKLVEIYKITNIKTNEVYIGRANVMVKNGNQKERKHGAQDRFETHHLKKAFSHNTLVKNECPLLYAAIRKYGKDVWDVEVLAVVHKDMKKQVETYFTCIYQSFVPGKGYNIFVGDSKPLFGVNKLKYEYTKAKANHDRAEGGVLKKNTDNKKLPSCVTCKYYPDKVSVRGYRVSRKIRGVQYDKSFIKHEVYTLEQLLEFAIRYRTELEKFAQDANYKIQEIKDY